MLTDWPPVAVALAFVDRVNHGDLVGLARVMTGDHELRVHDEPPVQGRDANVEAWQGYFGSFPGYRICPLRIAEAGDRVAVLGYTVGSHLGLPDDEERLLPVTWTAEVTDGAVRVWRVLEDTADRRRELGLDDGS
ncbi:nuclear transport factor 2 family protein [Amycolatopsis sp. RTGN1]|uniref:nuclear transport factor 2 family protein n=1 Tax=Amycolatopsis ponsaeliensis TaxID=2992142 RepID=UPI00254AB98D|nr:nuclear transport factor 2 family protein [Amycolatopsis sp. RTGN1]